MTALAIAGFHRSGTSALAQSLAALGVDFPGLLIGANEFNKFGYFEDKAVVGFHDGVLRRNGADWASDHRAPMVCSAEDSAWMRSYWKQHERPDRVWAFKDPRICLFLEPWKAAAPEMKLLVVFRHPAACAHSLYRRHAILKLRPGSDGSISSRFFAERDLALRLWALYNKRLLDCVEAHASDCAVIGHDSLKQIERVAELATRRFGPIIPNQRARGVFDPGAVHYDGAPLPVVDPALYDEVTAIWDRLLGAERRLGLESPPQAALSPEDFKIGAPADDLEKMMLSHQNAHLKKRVDELEKRFHLFDAADKLVARMTSRRWLSERLTKFLQKSR